MCIASIPRRSWTECYVCQKKFDGRRSEKEKEADMFASYFLAPYGSFKKYVQCHLERYGRKHVEIEDIIQTEQYFGLSRLATLIRMRQERFIKQEQFEEYQKVSVMSTACKMGYSPDLYLPTSVDKQKYTIGKYVRLANNLNQKELVSYSKYEEILLEAFRDDIVYGNGGELEID